MASLSRHGGHVIKRFAHCDKYVTLDKVITL